MVLPGVKRTLLILAAMAALASAVLAVSPPPAWSAEALQFTSIRCSYISSYRIFCEATWAGGTDPATGLWSNGLNSWIGPGQTDPAMHRTWAEGRCIPYPTSFPASLYSVQVKVTDATGQSVSAATAGGCPLSGLSS